MEFPRSTRPVSTLRWRALRTPARQGPAHHARHAGPPSNRSRGSGSASRSPTRRSGARARRGHGSGAAVRRSPVLATRARGSRIRRTGPTGRRGRGTRRGPSRPGRSSYSSNTCKEAALPVARALQRPLGEMFDVPTWPPSDLPYITADPREDPMTERTSSCETVRAECDSCRGHRPSSGHWPPPVT